MDSITRKREQEKRVVSEMIALYCHKHHGAKHGLCDDCAALEEYARSRSDHCPFMETKTFCANCRVHCYKSEMREKIRKGDAFFRAADALCTPHHGDSSRDFHQTRKEKIGG